MHPDTIAAMEALQAVLALHPDDAETLSIYGRLPDHLSDAIEDNKGNG
jgi:hypothetical protein